LENAFEIPFLHLHADELVLPVVRAWGIADLVIVSPDAGGLKRAQRYASALGAGLAVVAKSRPGPDAAVALQVLGDVRDRACLMVDDMASTGRTLITAAELLARAGAREIHGLFVHAVLAPGALERISAGPLRRIITTDSVPGALDPCIQIVPIASILARAVRQLARQP
jgi:ribose-phosphate pyrophosphokinase